MSNSKQRLGTLLVLAFTATFALAAANAWADQTSVDFETGPALRTPVQDDYVTSAFVRFPKNPGFRPYRTDVGTTIAHSGTVVGDVGGDVCLLEGNDPVDCEFATGGTTGQLTRTATAVTLFAGALQTPLAPETVTLSAHRTNGTTVQGSSVTITAAGVNQKLTVSSPAGDIDSFTLSADGGDLAFDDLSLDFPKNSLPDMRPTATSQVVPVLAGDQTSVNVDLNRVNGSHGPIRVSIAGLPKGVTAAPVTTDFDTTALLLKAATDAPSTDFVPTNATITADPLGNASVAPGRRSASLAVRVASPFDLQLAPGTSSTVSLGACAPTDVPVQIPRDIAVKDDITLQVQGVPAGVTAEVLPSTDILPGGGLTAERTLRFTRTTDAVLPATVTVVARNLTIERRMTLELQRATPSATLTSAFGLTARGDSLDGTEIRMTGNGFCPGTTVQVGNQQASAPTQRIDDHTISFHIPRLATSGPVTVIPPPGDSRFTTSGSLQVNNFRNTDGFQFVNFGFGALSIDELTNAFGADDLFVSINPCGIWGGHCKIQTGILDPIAAIDWGVLNLALRNSGGHCFGISRAIEQFLTGRQPLRSFTTGNTVFSIPSASGPDDFLTSYLDGQHALQGSDEFLHAWFNRDKSVKGQADRLEFALADGDVPIITLQHGGSGHAVVAYHETVHSDGTVDVDTYDNNRPFQPVEDTRDSVHQAAVEQSVLHLDTVNGSWSYVMSGGERWGGGDGGTMFVAPQFTIPQDPSLPGLQNLQDALEYVIFGSGNDAVRTTSTPAGADYLPALDSHAAPDAAGTLVARNPRHLLAASFRGVRPGRYSSAFVGRGFAASISSVATSRGVRDTVRGEGDTLSFAGSRNRALTVELAQRAPRPGGIAWSASLHTATSAGGTDSAGLAPGGTLSYQHHGAPARLTFTLSSLRPTGTARFDSQPVQVGRGDRLTVAPRAGLRSVALTIRDRGGHTRRLVLRNHGRSPARLTLAKPRLAGRHAIVRLRVRGLRTGALMGAVLRVFRGRRVIAVRSVSVAHARNGRRSFTFALPAGLRARDLLRANVRLLTTPARGVPTAASVMASSRARVTPSRRQAHS